MRGVRLGLVVALVAVHVSCGSDSGSTGGPGSGGATGTAGAGSTTSGAGGSTGTGGSSGTGGSTPGVCSGCAAAQGCLRVEVRRTADDMSQPWKVWPMEVDGVGTLIVTATPTMGTPVRKTFDGADMKPPTASYGVDIGCVPPSPLMVDVFLDDNGNAAPTASTSSDYRDSCGNPRSTSVSPIAGAAVATTFFLANSCD